MCNKKSVLTISVIVFNCHCSIHRNSQVNDIRWLSASNVYRECLLIPFKLHVIDDVNVCTASVIVGSLKCRKGDTER